MHQYTQMKQKKKYINYNQKKGKNIKKTIKKSPNRVRSKIMNRLW